MLFKALFIDSGLFNLPNEIVRKENDMENSWISDNETFGLPVHVFHFFFQTRKFMYKWLPECHR
jgi:hypothetical protein